jgi:HAMP domain-containing protein
MRLRTQILLGYWYLITLIVISAAGAALGFHRLGNNIGRVLTENFDSVRASTAMVESLERQDSAVLAVLLGDEGARDALKSSETTFSQALALARSNITMTDEVTVIDDIEQRFAEFTKSRDQLLVANPDFPLQAYEADTFPRFEEVKARVLDLLEINHRAMVEADVRAQSAASRRATILALLVLVALFSFAFLSRAMNRVVLERLDELSQVAEAIAAGSLERRAADDHPDELGLVARQLNAVLDDQQEQRGALEARATMYRGLVLGLMETFPEPSAVLGIDGRVIASTFDNTFDDRLESAGSRLPRPDEAPATPDQAQKFEHEGVRLRLLRTPAARPIAWLVTFAESP